MEVDHGYTGRTMEHESLCHSTHSLTWDLSIERCPYLDLIISRTPCHCSDSVPPSWWNVCILCWELYPLSYIGMNDEIDDDHSQPIQRTTTMIDGWMALIRCRSLILVFRSSCFPFRLLGKVSPFLIIIMHHDEIENSKLRITRSDRAVSLDLLLFVGLNGQSFQGCIFWKDIPQTILSLPPCHSITQGTTIS